MRRGNGEARRIKHSIPLMTSSVFGNPKRLLQNYETPERVQEHKPVDGRLDQ